MGAHQAELSEHDEGYELFRRAIVDRDEDAWREIHARYRALLIAWAHHTSAATEIGEGYEDIADQAFARAWMALSPDHFAQFPHLAGLLAYLHACVTAVAIDYARAQAARRRVFQKLEISSSATPEEIVLTEMDQIELWQFVNRLAVSEQERIVLIETFVFDLPPRTIVARHRGMFVDAGMVYATKRNLLARFQRNDELRRRCRDLLSA